LPFESAGGNVARVEEEAWTRGHGSSWNLTTVGGLDRVRE